MEIFHVVYSHLLRSSSKSAWTMDRKKRCSNKRHEVSRSTYLSNKGFASVFGLFFKLRLKLLILSP